MKPLMRVVNRGVTVCLFFKFSFCFWRLSNLVGLIRRAQLPALCYPAAAGHQLLFEHRFLCEPMMS
jgi:hypothetical protein